MAAALNALTIPARIAGSPTLLPIIQGVMLPCIHPIAGHPTNSMWKRRGGPTVISSAIPSLAGKSANTSEDPIYSAALQLITQTKPKY